MENSGRLYHRVPDPMFGEILYPLNRLAEINPALASAHAEKYRGRENLMAVRLAILDCLWNDALHLSPVHPAKIKTALLESGYPEKELGLRRFFAVDPRTLKPGRAVFSEIRKTLKENTTSRRAISPFLMTALTASSTTFRRTNGDISPGSRTKADGRCFGPGPPMFSIWESFPSRAMKSFRGRMGVAACANQDG